MKPAEARPPLSKGLLLGMAAALLSVFSAQAQSGLPQFMTLQQLTNKEVLVRLSAPANQNYRIEVSSDLSEWQPFLSLQSTGLNLHVDSATPFQSSRFYRAMQLSTPPLLMGDHLPTTNGDVVVRPINHASLVLSWRGLVIYNDPVGGTTPYTGLPRAELILVSHSHPDHYNNGTLEGVLGANGVILAPQAVYNSMTTLLRGRTTVMANGAVTNLLGLTVEAVPAYNSNHPLGTGNGYVITLGGKRFYFSGDTGNIAEMRALPNIDAAFLCINIPFTMTVSDALTAVRAFRPGIVYPYHYRDQSGATTNAASFKQQLGIDLGTEVRLRKWY